MQKAELTVEEVDKIFGPAMGRPKSAVFRTADIVGLDTFIHVAKNCYDTLTHDEERETFKPPRLPREDGGEGACSATRAARASTRRTRAAAGEKEILALDLKTLEYRPQKKVRFESLGAAKDVEDVRERVATVMNGHGQGRQVRRAGDAGRAGLRQPPHPGDRRRRRQRRPRRCAGASAGTLGPFETWDAYGVTQGRGADEGAGAQAGRRGWRRCSAAGREPSTACRTARDTYWDIPQQGGRSRCRRTPRDPARGVPQARQQEDRRQRQRHAVGHGRRRARCSSSTRR